MNLLKKWWLWVLVAIVILFLWQYLSGWAMSSKLYDMALDNLRQDESQVIKDKDEWIKSCEEEITKLRTENEQIEKEKAILRVENNKLIAERNGYKERIRELQTARETSVVPSDADSIVAEYHKFGFRSVRRHR